MSKWKLYWVASDGFEDCFVVAKNSRSAARIEKDTNGFEDEDLEVTRIMDVPDRYEEVANKKFRQWSKQNNCNTHLDIDKLCAWPYYAQQWLLDELGAEYRTIDGKEEVLINDIVIGQGYMYSIGIRAMNEISEIKGIDITKVTYEGMRETIDNMLGVSITTIHRIENYITESFVFAIGNKRYQEYTIREAMKYWKEKLTFGQLIQLIETSYDIDDTVRKALTLFLTQRNKIAHGLTKDERFDIDTIWGQKEIVGYLALFLRNAWALEEIFEAAYITSMCYGAHLVSKDMKENKKHKQDILTTLAEMEKDPYVLEKIGLFAETFKLKDIEK